MITYLKENAISIAIGIIGGLIVGTLALEHWNTVEPWYIANRPDTEYIQYDVAPEPQPTQTPTINIYRLYIEEDEMMIPEWEPVCLSDEELDVLARCVEAEAGNQDLYGRQLVVDVIFNRMDDEEFPDNVIDVIYQDNQFSVVSNGSINRVKPSELTYEAIALECDMRTNEDVLFFCSKGFLPYGEEWKKVGDHYFCVKEGE